MREWEQTQLKQLGSRHQKLVVSSIEYDSFVFQGGFKADVPLLLRVSTESLMFHVLLKF